MDFQVDRDVLLQSLTHIQGVVEKKTTLPILANVLIQANEEGLLITATDMDMIISEKINANVSTNGSTTTGSQALFDIVRKLPSNSKIHFALLDQKKLKLVSGMSDYELTCLSADEFPILEDNLDNESITIDATSFLKLLNKTKFAISNDETRHYLNGIFIGKDEGNKNLIAVATDGHRLSKTSINVDDNKNFHPVILPKKAIFELLSILNDQKDDIKVISTKSKIKFLIKNISLISKVIDGKFPDYSKVIPSDERIEIKADTAKFSTALDRLRALSSDRKGVIKIKIEQNNLLFTIKDITHGGGLEKIDTSYSGPNLEIGFNSNYLIDVANVIDSNKIILKAKDASSPIVICDEKDKLSTFVVMPMRVV